MLFRNQIYILNVYYQLNVYKGGENNYVTPGISKQIKKIGAW